MKFAPKEWWQQWTEFWRDVKAEMKKVSWPSKNEVVGTTGVVLGAVVLFGVYLWLCDLAFYKVIDMLFRRFGTGA
jgi:preprotein translocase subunit SecE